MWRRWQPDGGLWRAVRQLTGMAAAPERTPAPEESATAVARKMGPQRDFAVDFESRPDDVARTRGLETSSGALTRGLEQLEKGRSTAANRTPA